MIRFTWNGLNPWIIFKASINYFCLWIKIWFKDFRRQNIGTAVIKNSSQEGTKGQTMSNAQIETYKATVDKDAGKVLDVKPLQGSDEVQVTIQDLEEVEKTPTLH